MFFIPLLHLHLLIYSIYFSIHKYIDLLWTLHRPYIDPTSTLLSTFFNTASWIVKLYTTTTTTFLLFSLHHHHHHHHHISIVFPPPPPPPHFYCFSSTTTATFRLLSLHLLLIFIVSPPPPHFYCFPSKRPKGQNQTITFEFGLIGLILAFWSFRGKTIEMRRRWWWWRWRRRRRWRENNRNEAVVAVVEGKQ